MSDDPNVPKAKARRLYREMEKWQHRLRLCEYEVMWEVGDPDDRSGDCAAQINVNQKYRKAVITVWEWGDANGLEYCAKHELLHLATAELREIAMELAATLAPADALAMRDRIDIVEEQLVVRLCRAFDTLEHVGGEDDYYA